MWRRTAPRYVSRHTGYDTTSCDMTLYRKKSPRYVVKFFASLSWNYLDDRTLKIRRVATLPPSCQGFKRNTKLGIKKQTGHQYFFFSTRSVFFQLIQNCIKMLLFDINICYKHMFNTCLLSSGFCFDRILWLLVLNQATLPPSCQGFEPSTKKRFITNINTLVFKIVLLLREKKRLSTYTNWGFHSCFKANDGCYC